MAAPLLISANVRNMSSFTLATYSNRKVSFGTVDASPIAKKQPGHATSLNPSFPSILPHSFLLSFLTFLLCCYVYAPGKLSFFLPKVIAVNQDALAKQGFRVAGGNFTRTDPRAVAVTACNKADPLQQWQNSA